MRFRVLNKDPLYDYREACYITLGKDLSKEPDLKQPKDITAYWIKQIIANHSTIRSVRFRIIDTRPKTVIAQLIRATKEHPQPYVQSSRPDWNGGKERSSNPYEEILFGQDHTAPSFVEMAKQRLCSRTEGRTRTAMKELVNQMRQSNDPFIKAVGFCCESACCYGGCPEIKSCGMTDNKRYEKFLNTYEFVKTRL